MWSGVLFREHQVGRLISLVDNSIISISIESKKSNFQAKNVFNSVICGETDMEMIECAYFCGF